jgi:hypothetical protein
MVQESYEKPWDLEFGSILFLDKPIWIYIYVWFHYIYAYFSKEAYVCYSGFFGSG